MFVLPRDMSFCFRLTADSSESTHLKSTAATEEMILIICPVSLCVGDLPYEAHVQTHGGGAPRHPPVTSEERVPHHPHPHLPHLSFPHPTQPTLTPSPRKALGPLASSGRSA